MSAAKSKRRTAPGWCELCEQFDAMKAFDVKWGMHWSRVRSLREWVKAIRENESEVRNRILGPPRKTEGLRRPVPRWSDLDAFEDRLCEIERLLRTRREKQRVDAVHRLVSLWETAMRINRRVSEPNEATGRRVRDNLAVARKAQAEKRRDAAEEKHKEWRDRAREYQKKHPNASKNEIAIHLKKPPKLGESFKAIIESVETIRKRI